MTHPRTLIASGLALAACLTLGCGGGKKPAAETAEAEDALDDEDAEDDLDHERGESEFQMRMAPRPDIAHLAEGDGFQAALAYLKEASNKKPRKVRNLDGCYWVEFNKKEGEKFYEKHRQPLFVKGAYFFLFHNGYGMGTDSYALLPLTDPFEVLAALGTGGGNYDIGSQDVIDYLKKLHAEQPFILTGANGDFCAGTFQQPVKDADRLAQEMYNICPDIVDQGTESVEKLAEELTKTNKWFFWWD